MTGEQGGVEGGVFVLCNLCLETMSREYYMQSLYEKALYNHRDGLALGCSRAQQLYHKPCIRNIKNSFG